MICCKIIADFDNPNGSFKGLLEKLSEYGEVLWENNHLFFGETSTDFLTEKKIINILKKNNYTKFFVDIYSKDNQPKESDGINGWLNDKLIKINYNMYEKENQQMLKETMIGLDMLEKMVDQLHLEQDKEVKSNVTKVKEQK